MLNKENLLALGRATTKALMSANRKYSYNDAECTYENLNKTLTMELNEIAGTYSLFRENKNTLFALIEQTIDDVLPVRVLEAYGQFAETKVFKQGDKPIFIQKVTVASKRRAKQFITKVGLAGIYEVFKLDGQRYEVPTSAFGGAAQIGLEEMLDGMADWGTLVDIVLEGLDEAIYKEIAKALIGAVSSLEEGTNKITENGFVEAQMDKLLAIADSYGSKAEIYCTFEFAATMVPSAGWVSDEMRNQKWNNGYLANYKSHRVIVLPQSFEDETNKTKVIDPTYAWIIPSGGSDKPVKIAIESQDVRAVRGGTGYAKCGGNYAASLRAGKRAEEQGYTQVLWLDGVERKYIEEVGAMNVMFKINGKIVTPALSGSILPGITRKSCLELMRSWGYDVQERPISVDELLEAAASGALEEAWGTGTAAVVSPIGQLFYGGNTYTLSNNQIGELTQKLYDELTGIQWGKREDNFGWSHFVCNG